MFKTKIKHILKTYLPILAVVLFIVGQGVSIAHSYSHNENFSSKSQNEKHEKHHCALCFSANLQNQIFASASLIFASAIFYLVFFTRSLTRVKASYFRTSNSSRAPPSHS